MTGQLPMPVPLSLRYTWYQSYCIVSSFRSFVRLFGSPSVLSFFACSRIRSSFFRYLIHLLVLWFNPPLNKYTSDKQYRRVLWVKMSGVLFSVSHVYARIQTKSGRKTVWRMETKLFYLQEWCSNRGASECNGPTAVQDRRVLTAFLWRVNYHL